MIKLTIFELGQFILYLSISLLLYNDYPNFYSVFGLLFIILLVKVITSWCLSKGKTKLEKIFNYISSIAFSPLEWALYIVLPTTTQIWQQLLIIIVLLLIVAIGIKIRANSNSRSIINLLGLILIIIFILLFSIILSFADKEHSTIISAITALLILLLTTDIIESLFSVKISELRKEHLVILKYCLTMLVPIVYFSSIIIPIQPDGFSRRLLVGLQRFIILEVSLPLLILPIYITKLRKFVQRILGLPLDQLFLYGSWNMITKNKQTQHRVIVRNICFKIDGNRIKYNNRIYSFNEDFELFYGEESIGSLKKIDEDEICMELSSGKKIFMVKINSTKYKTFKRIDNEKEYKFYQKEVSEPLTNTKAEVSLFASPKNKNENYFIEVNSQTQEKYNLIDGKMKRIEDEEINNLDLVPPGLEECDTFI